MSRRRLIREDGTLNCSGCREWKFIGDFYTKTFQPGTSVPVSEIAYRDPETGKEYGKPSGYCRSCMRIRNRGKEAWAEHVANLPPLDNTDRLDWGQNTTREPAARAEDDARRHKVSWYEEIRDNPRVYVQRWGHEEYNKRLLDLKRELGM